MTLPLAQRYREPHWQLHHRVRRSSVPPTLRPWLLDTGSLTQRLITAAAGDFRVQVVRQCWARPMRNEAQALGLRPHARALVREVRLVCRDAPWVYARTVIPRATLTGAERRLARLRARSLGAVLFADPSTTRGDIEIVRLDSRDRLYRTAAAMADVPPPALWGRRARFLIKRKPLLVSEIFLPALGSFPE
jgi:chorismate lyase